MLKLIAFLGGAVLMGLEFVAQRALAPYFGNSIYVWGSIIAMVLAALSLGYYFGGRLADRFPDLRFLAWVLGVTGALLFWIPVFTPGVALSVSSAGMDPRLGSLIASLALYFVPSILLGTLSPYAVKLAATSLSTLGNTAGSMSAISNAGSIVGSLITSFVLVAWLGVRNMHLLFGGVLLALSASVLLFHWWRVGDPSRGTWTKTIPAIGVLLLTLLAFAGTMSVLPTRSAIPGVSGADEIVYESDSAYHHILVVDQGDQRHLRFDNSWQSGMYLDDPTALLYDYTKFFHLAFLFEPDPRRALFVGLGGGSVPKNFRGVYPELMMDVAEIDPEVIRVAQAYFGVEPDAHLRLYARDGRAMVRGKIDEYDMVFLDAYYSDSIPFHLTTVEFLQEVESALTADGVVVSNVIGSVSGDSSRLFRSMLKTFQRVFRQVYIFPVGLWVDPTTDPFVRNIILIATDDVERLSEADLGRVAERLWRSGQLGLDVRRLLRTYVRGRVPTDDVPLLTDDYAPVDTLLPVEL